MKLFAAALLLAAAMMTAQPSASYTDLSKGMMATGLAAEWHTTADGKDLKQMQQVIDDALQAGKVKGATGVGYGPGLMWVYRQGRKPKYWVAVQSLHDDVMELLKNGHTFTPHTFTPEERYSIATFLAAYSATAGEDFGPSLTLLDPHTKVGTAASTAVRADAATWNFASLVDTLEWMPASAEGRAELLKLVQERAAAIAKTPATAANSDVIPSRIRYYALLKAVRLGYLPQSYEKPAIDAASKLQTQPSSAPGSDLMEGAAAMLLSSELDQAATQGLAQGKVVAIDAWFNSQKRKGPTGKDELFHYKWNDDADSGFSFFGRAFQRYGARLSMIAEEPTAASLKGVSVYVIASPDIPVKNPNPNYVNAKDVEAIAQWVNQGGVLLLMQNDKTNAEFEHFNTLSERFGIHFNAVLRNTVEGTKYEQGKVVIPGTTGIFESPHTAYMKEICTISTQPPAQARLVDMLHDSGEVYMAVAKYGKGTVYAVVDPWLYNEYTDGHKLPAEFDQFAAAKDLAKWVLAQAK